MILIYGTRGCGFCKKAVDKCRKIGIKYEYRDIAIKKWYLDLVSKTENDYNVPKIFVDDKYIGNYKDLVEYVHKMRSTQQ